MNDAAMCTSIFPVRRLKPVGMVFLPIIIVKSALWGYVFFPFFCFSFYPLFMPHTFCYNEQTDWQLFFCKNFFCGKLQEILLNKNDKKVQKIISSSRFVKFDKIDHCFIMFTVNWMPRTFFNI